MPCLAVVGLKVQSGPGNCIVMIEERRWSEGSWVIQFLYARMRFPGPIVLYISPAEMEVLLSPIWI